MVSTTEIKPVLQAVDGLVDARNAMKSGKSAAISPKDKIAQAGGMTLNGARAITAEQKNAKHALEVEARAYEPGAMEKTVGLAGSFTGLLGMASFLGVGAVNLLGKGIGWIGSATGVSSIANTGKRISAPATWINNNDFKALGNKLGITETAGKISKATFGSIAWVAENSGMQRIVGRNLQARSVGKTYKHFIDARESAGLPGLSSIAEESIRDLRDHFKGAKNVSEIKTRFESAVGASENAVGGGIATLTKAENSVVTLNDKIANAEAALERMTKKGSGASKQAINDTKKFLSYVGKMSGSIESANGWGNIGASIRAVHGKLAEAKIAHTVMNGAFVAGSAVSMASDALSAKSQLHMLKEMYADMTGQNVNNVSTARVLFGSVPDPVRIGRSALVKQLLMKEGADFANVVINTKQAIDSKFSIAKSIIGFMGAEGISHLADGMVADHTAENYVGFKQAFLAAKAGGQELPAEQYAQFIGMVSPELAKRGGPQSRFSQEIGKQYAEAKLTPVEIMKEMSSGKIIARVHGIIDATKHHAPAESVAAGVTHTQKLGGAKNSMAVVGPHTNKVVSETSAETGVTRA